MKVLNAPRLLGFLLICHAATAQIITTVAGTDWSFPSGSLVAVNAPLGPVSSVAVDTAGNVFVADGADNLVLRISVSGTLNVVAGNGILGYSGDGGPATSASLNQCAAVAVDSAGNLYIADTGNQRIRKVSNGTITTVAGNGSEKFGGDGGPATSASFYFPSGLTLDSAGNLYIADTYNNRIRKVSNGAVTTVAGNGTQGFSGDGGLATGASLDLPYGVAVDSAGNVYIADENNNRVRKVSNGTITTVAGGGTPTYPSIGDGGPATSASLIPAGVTVDPSGNLYIADEGNSRIRKVSNGTITTVAGNASSGFSGDGGPATSASLHQPVGAAVDLNGNLFIADEGNNRIRKVSGGAITTFAGNGKYRFSGDGGPATSASLYSPNEVAVDSAGNFYFTDPLSARVRKVSNGTIATVAGTGVYAFSGDGGPAASASLNDPNGVAVDSAGSLYIADTHNLRIRKVSNGTIATVAGNGTVQFSANGVPATSDGIEPQGVAVDSAGNLYIADQVNDRILKVTNGTVATIATVAGNGVYGFSGDGGPATNASFDAYGVAVDSAGNIYIADAANNRIRKVSNGTITTIAGNGAAAFSGDGGPATSASLNSPFGVVVDSAGNLYIADYYNNRIRKVSNGTITTVAGNGNRGFAVDGVPATTASLAYPTGVTVDSAGNLYIVDSGNHRIREVLSTAPSFGSPLAAGASTLSLSQASGGEPVTATLTADTTAAAGSSIAVPGMAYTATVTSGSSWLSVSPASGTTPGLITVTANPLKLSQGSYNGVIALNVPLANPSVQSVNVQFTVTPGVPAAASVEPAQLSFNYATTSSARTQTLLVSNSGGGSLNFTTAISLVSGVSANWLSVTPQTGTATPGSPASLSVRADPSSLPSGTYTGSVTIQGGAAGSVAIPVTMTITTNQDVLLLTQTGLTFTAVQNGGAIPSQTFGVLNLGSGTLNWTVPAPTTLAGGSWLSATPGTGSSDAAAASGAPLVTVSVNPAGLQPGIYYGLVSVVSSGAANTPQQVAAVLQVLPAGTDVAPIVQPTSLIFTSAAGASSPGSQNVLVYDPTGTSKSFRSGSVSASGAGSLLTLPTDATIDPAEPTQIVVQPIVNGLTPGAYPGTLTLQFSDGRVSAVGITFAVTGAAGSSRAATAATSSVCAPTKLIPVLGTFSSGFAVPVGYPAGLSVQVTDDCGNPQTLGNVTAAFTNGDPELGLISLNNGGWQNTWTPAKGSGQSVHVIVTANTAPSATPQLTGTSEVDGLIGSPQAQPMVTPGGVVSAATFAPNTAVAPGSIIAIFGGLLADSANSAANLPLPTTLGNATVKIGGKVAPLFFASDGQINAVVPYGLNTNTTQQLYIQRDAAVSSPVALNVADAQPGAFLSSSGAIVTDYRGTAAPFLVTPSTPAQAGDVLVFYCEGLGLVNQTVTDGAGSPSAPTLATVTATIGGQTANVLYSGLVQGLVGLYQVNVLMPKGVPPGNAIPVTLTAAGQTSPAANISTQ